jgi:hypothetical protein
LTERVRVTRTPGGGSEVQHLDEPADLDRFPGVCGNLWQLFLRKELIAETPRPGIHRRAVSDDRPCRAARGRPAAQRECGRAAGPAAPHGARPSEIAVCADRPTTGRRWYAVPARKEKRQASVGAHALKFLYPKGAAEPRLVLMKSWVRQGPLITGFDIEAEGIRSFFWDKIDKFLPLDAGEQNKGAGKFRRAGHIKRAAMFRKLRKWAQPAQRRDRSGGMGRFQRSCRRDRARQSGGAERPVCCEGEGGAICPPPAAGRHRCRA